MQFHVVFPLIPIASADGNVATAESQKSFWLGFHWQTFHYAN
jgi:hypothetical protein